LRRCERSDTPLDADIVADAWNHIALGCPDDIPDCLKGDFVPDTHPMFPTVIQNIVRLRYRYAKGEYVKILNYLKDLDNRPYVLTGRIICKTIEACAYYLQRRRQEAVDTLAAAYRLAEPHGIIFPFIEMGKIWRVLCPAR